MSETEEDRAYYAAGETAFIRRRGTPFLLSPKDFALLRQWRQLGIPIEAVEDGIDEAFTQRQERSAAGRVNSLAYCRDAVLEAWERRSAAAVGRGGGRRAPGADPAATLGQLATSLSEVARLRPDLAATLESPLRALERLRSSGKTAEQIEESLARLDRKAAGALLEALPEAERAALAARVESLLAPARDRMDAQTAEKTSRALTRRALRELLDLPRLTLLPA